MPHSAHKYAVALDPAREPLASATWDQNVGPLAAWAATVADGRQVPATGLPPVLCWDTSKAPRLPDLLVRPLTPDDRSWVRAAMVRDWSSKTVARRGELIQTTDQPGYVALLGGRRIGVVLVDARAKRKIVIRNLLDCSPVVRT